MKNNFQLDANERVLKEVKRHWISLVPVYGSAIVLAVFGLAVVYGAARFGADLGDYVTPGLLYVLAFAIFVLAGMIFALGVWVYNQNRLMLTNLHLIQVEQAGLFNRTVSQLSLARVQDVTGSTKGLLATMLSYGNIEVQTAGEQEKFVFELAPNPTALADECLQAHENFVTTNPDSGEA